MRNIGDGGEYQPTAKNLLIFPTRKILLNKFTSSTIKTFTSFPSNSNLHLITLYKLHLQLQSLLLCLFFNFRLYMFARVMLILINQCILNVVFGITKALTGQIAPKQQFYYLHLFFPLFHTHFFISNLIKFQLTPLPSWDFVGCALIKYNGFQISGNKSNETPYLMSQIIILKKKR